MSKLDILVVGSGAREHAFGWAVKQSPRCGKLYFAPGNAGTARIGENLPYAVSDLELLLAFCQGEKIGLVIVGPEAPLKMGIVDGFRECGITIMGPTQEAAQLETSKIFAKTLMRDIGVPTAPFRAFTDYSQAITAACHLPLPFFVKADGLCGGKGAIPCHTYEEAGNAVRAFMFERKVGNAGEKILIEDFLSGEEVSVHAFCDQSGVRFAPPTQDHKRLLADGRTRPDGTNPNTGGMGAIGPVPSITLARMVEIDHCIIEPLEREMHRRGIPYTGILYPGLMMTKQGPQVLEFNCRGGDPETQVLMRLLKSDAVDLFEATAMNRLDDGRVQWHEDVHAACVVLAASGYPENPRVGDEIIGIEEAEAIPDVVVFHAGTKILDGRLVTAGGRVLSVTATGATLGEALAKAYRAVETIHFDGMQYRNDIGKRAQELELARELA